jgi:hypothetical protein
MVHYSPTPNQARFLAAYAHVGIIGKAAEMAGINRRTHILWMHTDRGYCAMFARAHEAACAAGALEMDRLAEVRRRAAARRPRRGLL